MLRMDSVKDHAKRVSSCRRWAIVAFALVSYLWFCQPAGCQQQEGALVPVLRKGGNRDFDQGTGSCVAGNGDCGSEGNTQGRGEVTLASLRRASPEGDTCPSEIGWFTSGFWSKDKARAFILDSTSRSFMIFDQRGEPVGFLNHFGDRNFKVNVPLNTVERDGGYLAMVDESRDTKLLWLDSTLKPVDTEESELSSHGITSIYDWASNEESIIVCGAKVVDDLKSNKTQVSIGFFRLTVERDRATGYRLDDAKKILTLGSNSAYLLGNKNIAVAGGRIYFLAVDHDSAVYKIGRTVQRLRAFPEDYRNIGAPNIRSTGPEDSERIFGEIEKRRAAVGLYSDGTYLFVLTRRPAEGGATTWYLHAIDPVEDKLVGKPIRIPSMAPHLFILPGDPNWLVFEKGSVSFWGRQVVKGVIPLPANWLRSQMLTRGLAPEPKSTTLCATQFRDPMLFLLPEAGRSITTLQCSRGGASIAAHGE
jgi:hypothetical protein